MALYPTAIRRDAPRIDNPRSPSTASQWPPPPHPLRPPFPPVPSTNCEVHATPSPLIGESRSSKSPSTPKAMGQIVSAIQGKGSREVKIRAISDHVFDRIKKESTKENLTLEDLNIAVLYLYNDLNKYLPGGHHDPPSRSQLKALVQQYDLNLDGQLNRDEFFEFVKKMTNDVATSVGKNLFVALIVAPAVAVLTKKSTEGVPGVGKTVEKIPISIYASVVATAVLLLQNVGQPSLP